MNDYIVSYETIKDHKLYNIPYKELWFVVFVNLKIDFIAIFLDYEVKFDGIKNIDYTFFVLAICLFIGGCFWIGIYYEYYYKFTKYNNEEDKNLF